MPLRKSSDLLMHKLLLNTDATVKAILTKMGMNPVTDNYIFYFNKTINPGLNAWGIPESEEFTPKPKQELLTRRKSLDG